MWPLFLWSITTYVGYKQSHPQVTYYNIRVYSGREGWVNHSPYNYVLGTVIDHAFVRLGFTIATDNQKEVLKFIGGHDVL